VILMLYKYCKVCKYIDKCEYGNAFWHSCQHVKDAVDNMLGSDIR